MICASLLLPPLLLDNILLSSGAAAGAAWPAVTEFRCTSLACLQSFSLPPPSTLLLPTSPPHSLACARGLMVLECHCCGFFSFSALFSKEYFGLMPRDQSIPVDSFLAHLSLPPPLCDFFFFPPRPPDGQRQPVHPPLPTLPAPSLNLSLTFLRPESERLLAPWLQLPPFHPVYKMPTVMGVVVMVGGP